MPPSYRTVNPIAAYLFQFLKIVVTTVYDFGVSEMLIS